MYAHIVAPDCCWLLMAAVASDTHGGHTHHRLHGSAQRQLPPPVVAAAAVATPAHVMPVCCTQCPPAHGVAEAQLALPLPTCAGPTRSLKASTAMSLMTASRLRAFEQCLGTRATLPATCAAWLAPCYTRHAWHAPESMPSSSHSSASNSIELELQALTPGIVGREQAVQLLTPQTIAWTR